MASHHKEGPSAGLGIINLVLNKVKLIPTETELHVAMFFFILITKSLKH